MGPQLLLHATPLNQFLEPPQGQTDGFLVMHTHPQAHSSSIRGSDFRRIAKGLGVPMIRKH
jgi:hypothetical protein